MPTMTRQFSSECHDIIRKRLIDCLHDMKSASDRPHMLAIRERCKERMRQAMLSLDELRDAHDDLAEKVGDAELTAQVWEDRYRRLQHDIGDFPILIDAAELKRRASDYAEGKRKVTT